MARFGRETENEDGWSDWINPLPGYRMACCDCGLVHNLEFRIDDLGQINFRASRNNRSTAQMRRHMKPVPGPDTLKGAIAKTQERRDKFVAAAIRAISSVPPSDS